MYGKTSNLLFLKKKQGSVSCSALGINARMSDQYQSSKSIGNQVPASPEVVQIPEKVTSSELVENPQVQLAFAQNSFKILQKNENTQKENNSQYPCDKTHSRYEECIKLFKQYDSLP